MEREKITKPSKYDLSSFISKIFFSWVLPLFFYGYKNNLSINDLSKCPDNDRVEVVGQRLWNNWTKECKSKKPSLVKAIIKTFGVEYLLINLVLIYEEGFIRIGQPFLLGLMVRYFNADTEVDNETAIAAAVGICLCSMLFVISHHPYVVRTGQIGMRAKTACSSLIYKKVLKLSKMSMNHTTIGNVINLISNDINRFDELSMFLGYLIMGPVQTIIIVIILWQYLGPACLAGVLCLVSFTAFQGLMGKLFSVVRSKTAARTDERIRMMNEILSGMKVIKMYSWENAFSDLINKARKQEVDSIRRACILKAINLTFFFVGSRAVLFACFVAFVLTGGKLTAETVFVSMALFNTLRLTMTFLFPLAIAYGAEGLVSCRRLQKFLLLPEKATEEISGLANFDKLETDGTDEISKSITIRNLAAKYDQDAKEPIIRNINAVIEPGQLLAVIGPVGSGKSSLLMALLREMSTSLGSIKIEGRIGYASQEPWSFNASVRDNILFGSPFEEAKYNKVVKATALLRDFEILPYGDKTLVGEKGVTLSGGQKARVSLARTVYNDSDIYLLDDPLSAVDASVANHIFDKCIMGFLRQKTRILVTHQLQFIKKADKIIVLTEGRSVAYGTFIELLSSGLDFVSLLKVEEDEKKKEESIEQIGKEVEKVLHSFRRGTSYSSYSSSHGENFDFTTEENFVGPKVEEETKLMGSIGSKVYVEYIKSGAGIFLFLSALAFTLMSQIIYHSCDFWLTGWTNAEDYRIHSNDSSAIDETYEVVIYSSLTLALLVTTFLRTILFFLMCMTASIKLHNSSFYRIFRSPMSFFDNNPVGRILNRFSRDLGIIDELLPSTAFDLNLSLGNSFGIIVVVGIISPILVVPAVVLTVIIILVRRIYIKTARDIKRFEALARSPIYSHITNTYNGISTIRAFNSQEAFEKQFNIYINDHSATWFLHISANRALGVVMDWICLSYICIVTTVLMFFHEGIPGGSAGLALSSAITLTGMFQWGIRQSSEFESQMTAVERVLEYTKLPSEAELEAPPDKRPSDDWPAEGRITFMSVSLTYPPAPTPVLNNLNFEVEGGQKIGIVGRTGAGKSSLLASLFRMVEPSGLIMIDQIDVKTVGLHDLRKKISIIPQDPVVFSGPVRRNIDPFGTYTDDELWKALEDVQLKDVIHELPGNLDAHISEGGSNFSVGQRQLICLARAILRRNKILVLDEATANVDHKTDALIQLAIREKFNNCTVLTIAHRLNTIIDSDKVLVLDAGRVEEFDSPYLLLLNRDSLFFKLVEQTGKTMAAQLLVTAREAYEKRDGTSLKKINIHC